MCNFRDHFLDPFFGILLITEDENLDSVLFFTALLRREQSLKMCFLFGPLDHFGVQFGAQNWPKNQQKMCSLGDHCLDPLDRKSVV